MKSDDKEIFRLEPGASPCVESLSIQFQESPKD